MSSSSNFALLPLLLFFLLTGCVSKSTYLQKENEALQLEQTAADLQADLAEARQEIAELQARNSALGEELGQAQDRGAALEQDLVRARADLDRLETVLAARSSEAGSAMAEMRRTIDRLQEENRTLTAAMETERIAREARLAHLQSTHDELMEKMESEITRGEVTISELQGRLTVNLVEKILFDSGQTEVKPAGLEILQRVGEILMQAQDKEIRVEGHTDNIPISSRLRQRFPSNWELSTARATNVLHFLQDRVGIPGEKLSACGFGEFRPIGDNGTQEGRAQNRRIQIVLVPLEAQTLQPLQ